MRRSAWLILTLVPLSSIAAPATQKEIATLFTQWREFQRPPRANGVPDYSPKAMSAQAKALPGWLTRAARSTSPAHRSPLRQVDYQIVRAEMNGLDFDHRVLKPVGQRPRVLRHGVLRRERPARARGPRAPRRRRALDATSFRCPPPTRPRSTPGLRADPAAARARPRTNLTGNGKDLWTLRRSEPSESRALTLDGVRAEARRRRGRRSPPTSQGDSAATEDFAAGSSAGRVEDRPRPASASRTTTGT